MKKEIRVGLIGSKFMGIAHSNAFRNANTWFELPYNIKLKAICATNNDNTLPQFAAKYGWESFETDWRHMIDRDDIDLISVATPGYLHKDMVIEAARKGKHILCEKPLANTLSDAEAMLAEAEKAGIRHCCGFSYRFTPSMALAKQFVQEGRLGRIFHVHARYAQDWIVDPEFPMVWRLDKGLAGSGPLGDLSAHSVDACRFITGLDFTEVMGNMKTFIPERKQAIDSEKKAVTVEDTAQFLVNFANGAVGNFESTRFASGRKNYNCIEVNGEYGSIVWNFEDQNYLSYYDNRHQPSEAGFRKINVTHDTHPYSGGYWPQGHGIGYADTFVIEVAEFIKAIAEDKPFSPDFKDGVCCQKVLDAVERSNTERKWILL